MIQRTLSYPIHVAVIMDGNGRWATQRGEPRWTGHRAGAVAARALIEHCARRGVRQLTLYAFSSDNWQRPRPEVAAILGLCERHLREESDRLVEAGIRTSAIGRRDRLPAALRGAIEDVEALTRGGRGMDLRLALDYSSRASLAECLTVSRTNAFGATNALGVTGATGAPGARRPGATILPPVDLLIRTGGERRLSDFLLWECAYAELAFLDVLFPDLTTAQLDATLADFAQRERRYGDVPHLETA